VIGGAVHLCGPPAVKRAAEAMQDRRRVLLIDTGGNGQKIFLPLQNGGSGSSRYPTSGEGVQCLLDDPGAAVVVGEEMPPLAGVELITRLGRMTQSPIVVLGAERRWPSRMCS
jgi:hypothetical protein